MDVALTFFFSLSLVLFLRVLHEPRLKWCLLSGTAIGLAAATKYNGALLLPVLLIVHLLRSTSLKGALSSLRSAPLLSSILLSGLVFLALNPLILAHHSEFFTKFSGLEATVGSVNLGMDSKSSSAGYYLFDCLPTNLGWILALMILISIGYLIPQKRKDYYLLIAAILVFFGVTISWGARAERYILPIIPSFVAIGAIGLAKLSDGLPGFLAGLKSGPSVMKGRLSSIVVLMLVCLAIFKPLADVIAYERSYSLPDTRSITKQWILDHVEKGSSIAVGFYGLELPAKTYVLMPIQYTAQQSEKMAPFYDARWYEDMDLVITSDYDYGRYELEPERFAEILHFYDTLQSRWTLVNEIKSGQTNRGPTFWLYKCPPSQRHPLFEAGLLSRLSRVENPERVRDFLGKLGLILLYKGPLQKSEQLFLLLTAIDPSNLEAHQKLLEAEYGLKHYDQALRQVDTCLRLGGNRPNLYVMKGKILTFSGEYDEAVSSLKAALTIDNRLEAAYEQLMLAYAYQNKKKEILSVLTEYRKILPPGSEKARLVDRRMERLKGGK